MLTTPDIERKIKDHVIRILRDNDRDASDVAVDAELTKDIGLDSLALASLFIALEDEFRVDPFEGRFSLVEMRTIADLTRAYATALGERAAA